MNQIPYQPRGEVDSDEKTVQIPQDKVKALPVPPDLDISLWGLECMSTSAENKSQRETSHKHSQKL